MVTNKVGVASRLRPSRYLVEALLSLHVVHASRQRHVALPPVLSAQAVGWRRRLAQGDLAVGGRQAGFGTSRRGAPSRQGLLSVVNQLPATDGGKTLASLPRGHNKRRAELELVRVNSLQDVSLLQIVFAAIFQGHIVDSLDRSVDGLQHFVLLWGLPKKQSEGRGGGEVCRVSMKFSLA